MYVCMYVWLLSGFLYPSNQSVMAASSTIAAPSCPLPSTQFHRVPAQWRLRASPLTSPTSSSSSIHFSRETFESFLLRTQESICTEVIMSHPIFECVREFLCQFFQSCKHIGLFSSHHSWLQLMGVGNSSARMNGLEGTILLMGTTTNFPSNLYQISHTCFLQYLTKSKEFFRFSLLPIYMYSKFRTQYNIWYQGTIYILFSKRHESRKGNAPLIEHHEHRKVLQSMSIFFFQ